MSAEVIDYPATAGSTPAVVTEFPSSLPHSATSSLELVTGQGLITEVGSLEIEGHEVPWTLTFPKYASSSVGRLIIPGFFGVEATYDAAREAGARDDTATVTFDPPRSSHDVLHPTHLLAKASWGVVKAMGKRGIEAVDVIGHSMGGPAAVRMTNHQLDHTADTTIPIRSVTLADSAGTTGHSTAELAARTVLILGELVTHGTHFRHGDQAPHRTPMGAAIARYAFTNPSQTLLEGLACGHTDIYNEVASLTRAGMPTAAIGHADDHYFPADRMQRHIGSAVGLFMQGNPPAGAGHFGPQLYPEEFTADHRAVVERLGLTVT